MTFGHTLKKITSVILISLPSLTAFAETHQLNPRAQTPYDLTVSQSSRDGILLKFSLNHFEIDQRNLASQIFSDLSLVGASHLDLKGMPALPKVSKDLAIPFSSSATLRVVSEKTRKLKIAPPTPSRGEVSRCFSYDDIRYEPDQNFYQSDRVYPEQKFSLSQPFLFRDVKGVNLQFIPFSFQAATGELIVTESATLEIRLSYPQYSDNRLTKRAIQNKSFHDLYQHHFANFQTTLGSYEEVTDQGELLIISHNKFIGQMAPFVEWKRKMGFRTHLNNLRDIGESYEDVKKFIKNFYTENPALSFVLFVGDAEFVPYHEGQSGNANGNEADPMYGLIEGNDSYPEVIIGRFPAKNAEDVSNMILRSINYEKNPAPGDWYRKAIGVASNEGSPTDGQRADMLKDILMQSRYTAVDKLYDPGVRASDISAVLNEGRGLVNYIGHGNETSWGTGNFDNSDIRALKNSGKLPVIVDVACLNGRFGNKSDSFAETWLKAGTAENPTGAIAIFASSTEQDWVPPTVGQKEIAKFISQGTYRTVGALFTNGSIAVLEDGAGTAKQTFETWHIFGDPTLKIRTHQN